MTANKYSDLKIQRASTSHLKLSEKARQNIGRLMEENQIVFRYCRRISDELQNFNLELNEYGFSEKWDTLGLFIDRRKTIYIPSEVWVKKQNTGRNLTPEEVLQTEIHETGHAIDHCLGRPSRTDEFIEAWKEDIENFPYGESAKNKILSRTLEERGNGELWANFFEWSVTGICPNIDAKYFPRAMEVYNRQVAKIGLMPIQNDDLKGYGVDYALGYHSRTADFLKAWHKDLENYQFSNESKAKILGPLMDKDKGPSHVWANFYDFSTKGKNKNIGALYFPRAMKVFNQICPKIGIKPLCIEQYDDTMDIKGKPTPIKRSRLARLEI